MRLTPVDTRELATCSFLTASEYAVCDPSISPITLACRATNLDADSFLRASASSMGPWFLSEHRQFDGE